MEGCHMWGLDRHALRATLWTAPRLHLSATVAASSPHYSMSILWLTGHRAVATRSFIPPGGNHFRIPSCPTPMQNLCTLEKKEDHCGDSYY